MTGNSVRLFPKHLPHSKLQERGVAERGRGEGSDYLLTVREVAEQLKMHPSSVYDLINACELPAVRLGQRATRILRSDVEALVERKRVVGGPATPYPQPFIERPPWLEELLAGRKE